METTTFIIDRTPSFEFKIVANRYRSARSLPQTRGVTLIFAHGIGAHKEQWERVIEQLLREPERMSGDRLIREAWAVDCFNHGDAGGVAPYTSTDNCLSYISQNQRQHFAEPGAGSLRLGHPSNYAKSIRQLILSGPIDLSEHNLVAVGHSMGAISMILSWSLLATAPKLDYKALILVEPMFAHPSYEKQVKKSWDRVMDAVRVRKDWWPNRNAAYSFFKTRLVDWDDSVLVSYVKEALYDVETGPEGQEGGVALKCRKEHEAAFNLNLERIDAWQHLSDVSGEIPTYAIFADGHTILPTFEAKGQIHCPEEGRQMMSVSYIQKSGHNVQATNPRELAEVISQIIIGRFNELEKSRL